MTFRESQYKYTQRYPNLPSSSGSSSGLSSTNSKAWVKHHCCASCLPTPESIKAPEVAMHWLCIHNWLISCRSAQLTVFTDPVAHQNEHLWREILHHWDPWIQLLQASLLQTTGHQLTLQICGAMTRPSQNIPKYLWAVKVSDESLHGLRNLWRHLKGARHDAQVDIRGVVLVVDGPRIPGYTLLSLDGFR